MRPVVSFFSFAEPLVQFGDVAELVSSGIRGFGFVRSIGRTWNPGQEDCRYGKVMRNKTESGG